jgi:hypothetical protein
MFRRSLIILTLLLAVFALGASLRGSDDVEARGPPGGFTLPPQAREVAPDVWFLGTAIVDGARVQGYAFVHRRDSAAKPPWAGGPGNGGGGGDDGGAAGTTDGNSSCYAFIAKDAKWKT